MTSILVLSDSQEKEKQGRVLSEIEANSITDIKIHQNDKVDIVFKRQGPHWSMSKPLSARVNPARIDSILHILKSISYAQIARKDANLASFQLDAPAVVLKLNQHSFEFGATEPINERRYIMFNDTIHLVNDSLYYQLLQSPMFFLSKKLVPETEKLVSVQMTNQLLTRLNKSWSVITSDDMAENNRKEELLNAWETAEAQYVQKYDITDLGKKVILTYASGNTTQFDLVFGELEFVLGRADLDLQYHLKKNTYEHLFINTSVSEHD